MIEFILSAGSWAFVAALVPQLRAHDKPPLFSSLFTAFWLFVYAACFVLLGLTWSALSSAALAATWAALGVQKLRQKKLIKSLPRVQGLFDDPASRGPSINTVKGGRFWVLNPRPEDVDVEEVAHALCNICRWTGQITERYSVGAHSMFVSKTLEEFERDLGSPPERARRMALLGLMHDAHEAYLGDISRPVKVMIRQLHPGMIEMVDDRFERCVADALGLHATADERRLIKWADNVALALEGLQLVGPVGARKPWMDDLPDCEGYELEKNPTPQEFLARFSELAGIRF